MPLRNVADALDSDSHYSTVLELREEHRFMRKSRQGPPVENRQEDTVIALVDFHRAHERAISGMDSVPPSRTRRRGSP